MSTQIDSPYLSIIVPVYNKTHYLEECINSILSQSFKDFELILINDGSTDNSGEKCDHFKLIDNRVIVIHQKNQGVSAARNAGLNICQSGPGSIRSLRPNERFRSTVICG